MITICSLKERLNRQMFEKKRLSDERNLFYSLNLCVAIL